MLRRGVLDVDLRTATACVHSGLSSRQGSEVIFSPARAIPTAPNWPSRTGPGLYQKPPRRDHDPALIRPPIRKEKFATVPDVALKREASSATAPHGELSRLVAQAANTDANTLITGETGTGRTFRRAS
jgi:two-component system NtrC family response regulator